MMLLLSLVWIQALRQVMSPWSVQPGNQCGVFVSVTRYCAAIIPVSCRHTQPLKAWCEHASALNEGICPQTGLLCCLAYGPAQPKD